MAVAALNPTWVRDSFLPYLKTLEEAGFDLASPPRPYLFYLAKLFCSRSICSVLLGNGSF
jgi:hypothetical protein